LRYRDDLTEGYNITPNFFIQAFVQLNELDFEHHFELDKSKTQFVNQHFENRLFDRDTLTIHHFKINFLFVLNSYLSLNINSLNYDKSIFKKEIKQAILNYYQTNFEFYSIKPLISAADFMERYFQKLIGKVYRSSETQEELILAWKTNFEVEEKDKLLVAIQKIAVFKKLKL
jgi:hypothetical protein